MVRKEKIEIRLGNTKFAHIGKIGKFKNIREYRFIEVPESNREMGKVVAECLSRVMPEAKDLSVLFIALRININRMDLCNAKVELQLLDTNKVENIYGEEYVKYIPIKVKMHVDDVLKLLELVDDEELKNAWRNNIGVSNDTLV